jgi:hypothetical protein
MFSTYFAVNFEIFKLPANLFSPTNSESNTINWWNLCIETSAIWKHYKELLAQVETTSITTEVCKPTIKNYWIIQSVLRMYRDDYF